MIIDTAIIVLACAVGRKNVYAQARASNERMEKLMEMKQ